MKDRKVYEIGTGVVEKNGKTTVDVQNYSSYTVIALDAEGAIGEVKKFKLDKGEYIESVKVVAVLS